MSTKEKDYEISKSDRNFHIVNYCLMIFFTMVCVGLGIYYFVIGDPNNRLLASVGVSILFILPILIELIFRCRISNFILLCYIVYSVLAGLMGCLLNFYNTSTFGLDVWYDVFIHTLAGYVFCFIGIILVSRFEKYKKLSPWTILLFCVFFTLAVELVWELMEWFADNCLGQQSQGHPPIGQPAPLVTDTNIDMLCNFSGSVLFAIHFIIGRFSKCKLGMNYIENELSGNKIIRRRPKKMKNKPVEDYVSENKNDADLTENNKENIEIIQQENLENKEEEN